MPGKPQRIRDPLHNLIEFRADQFERVMWQVIQTPPFQRLRRVRQLGFSEFVYPGATHTRFAHSVGVFHSARQLMRIIEEHLGQQNYLEHQARVALAASLVHDVGHGMFSHAFEDVGKTLGLKLAEHENVSVSLIRDSEISEVFTELGSGFANDVAEVIGRGRPGNLYDAVVSSQFDADRLDYMQRDRLMSGVQNSGIDLVWLMANLEIGKLPVGVDEEQVGSIDTFVLGPKATHAAEAYVLALFQLYPTVYFHKATRAAEKTFSALMARIIGLIREGHVEKTGLSDYHPISCFARDPDKLGYIVNLDDTVFWGALPMLVDAADSAIQKLASRLRERRLLKCIDIREQLVSELGIVPKVPEDVRARRLKKLERIALGIEERLVEWSEENSKDEPRIVIDRASRDCYKKFQDSKGPLNQIRIRIGNEVLDMAESSRVVGDVESFELFRAYTDDMDEDAKEMVRSTKKDVTEGDSDADGVA
jgi:uncharacterized protein